VTPHADARDDPAEEAETIVGLNSIADVGGRARNGCSVTAVRTPALTVIPANAGIQRFTQFCLVAMDARVRGRDTQGPGSVEQARRAWP
jgi:hypothetical protein